MAEAPNSGIGTEVSISVSTPATEDQAGYEALTFTEIAKVVAPFPELNESSETGTETLLKDGVTQHFNGAKMVNPFDVSWVYSSSDAGQGHVRTNVNTNTEVTLKVAYPNSGKTVYVQGVLGDLRTKEATTNTSQGETVQFRPISLATTV